MASAIALTRASTGCLSSSATRLRSSATGVNLCCELDERQRLGGTQVDRSARFRVERFAVEDDARALAFDRDLVGLPEMHTPHLCPAELAGDACGNRAKQGSGPLLHREHLERAAAAADKL